MVQDLTTKETAKLLREELKRTYPGVKFSVRCGTGSACDWIHVGWNDGPTASQVSRTASYYEGRRFDGMTDSYNKVDNRLITTTTPDELPEEVRFRCSGINEHRSYSDEFVRSVVGKLAEENEWFLDLLIESGIDTARVTYNEAMNELRARPMPDNRWFRFNGQLLPGMPSGDVGMVIHGALYRTAMTADGPVLTSDY